jgi:hypothetical protein
MAEASFEQARKIFERSLEGVQATAGSIEKRCANASAKEVIAKALADAEKNVQVSLDYTQSRICPGVMRLHRDFGQSQMCSVAGGTGKRNSQIGSAALDAAKPKI